MPRGTAPRLSSYIYGLRLRLGSDANPLRRWSLIQVRSRGTSGWSTCHSMKPRFAILLDGGFVTKSLQKRKGQFPAATDVMQETARVRARPELAGQDLLRVYFYDAPPATAALKNPIDGSSLHLGSGNVFQRGKALLEALELQADFAVRRGDTVVRGWKLGAAAQKNLIQNPRALQASDLVPNVQQKAVDLRIGLDIALLSLRHLVQTIVVITGDSDLIPAFKFARREGIRVYLDHMGSPVRRELQVHTDIVF